MSLIHTLIPIWLLLLCGTIIAAIFNIGTVAVCLLTGVKYTKIAIFYGKPVISLKTRIGAVVFGYLPMGGYIQLDMDAFPQEPRFKRAAIALSGPVALLLSSLLCLGLHRAGSSFASTYHQLLEWIISPGSKSKEFFNLFSTLIQSHPIAGYGILAAKAGMLNLLPMPTLAGGRLLVELCPTRDGSKLAKALNYFGSVIAICIFVLFAYFFISYLFR